MRARHSTIPAEVFDLVPLSEAARAIPLSRGTAYLEVARGNLPAVKVAGRLVVARGDLETYIANRGTPEVSASGLAAITGGGRDDR